VAQAQLEQTQMVQVVVVVALQVMVEMPQEQLAELVDLAVAEAVLLLAQAVTAATESFTFSTREQL
jgi:hypothetical protein